ncbi:6616_t:CDS:2 [Entrophospora sp. SA101]|nr:6613_t:CDS:2 [Entrophospora sp. SA101]CAJ0829835.1 6616_t:CDS:2 [Entrophospora sp. SA101]
MTIMISLLLLMFNLIGFVNGQDVTPTDITAPSPTTITTDNPVVDLSNNVQQLSMAQSIVVGVILLVIGFCYCFFGRKLYNLTLFILGSIIGSYVAFLILVRAEPPSGYTSEPSTNTLIILLVSLAIGFIVGMLLICCASNDIARIVFIVAFAITGLILACIFEDVIIILGTSFIGAYAMILGVDMFANTGFRLSVRAFLDGTPYTTSRDVYLMLGGLIALFIAGSLIQYKFHRNHHFGPSHPKGYDKSVESGNGSDHAPVTEKKKGGYTGIFSKNKS